MSCDITVTSPLTPALWITLMSPPKERERGCFLQGAGGVWWAVSGGVADVVCLTSCRKQMQGTIVQIVRPERRSERSWTPTWRMSFFFLAESGMLWWTCLKSSFRASSVYCCAGD